MDKTIAELKAVAMDQEAWGKRNTAPLWDEIARREDEMRTPLQLSVRRIGGTLLIAAICALAYAPIVFPAAKFFI